MLRIWIVSRKINKLSNSAKRITWKSEKHSFVILSDSEEYDIIEILRRSAPQNDTTWAFYEYINF